MHTKRLSLFSMMFLIPLIFGVMLVGLLSSQPTQAAPNATHTVTNLNDSGAGSLRQTINDANLGDTIDFGVSGIITLTSGELVISKSLTINGGHAITVSGNNTSRVFNVTAGNVTFDSLSIINGMVENPCRTELVLCRRGMMEQNSGTTVAVSNTPLSINSAGYGGGISNSGTLTVRDSILSGNSAYYGGGGIENSGTLTVSNSTLSGNSANGGGGIDNSGTLTMSNSTLSGNSAGSIGGGIYNYGTLSVRNSTLSGNSAGNDGGGISNNGTLTVSNSTLSGNSASSNGGGISNNYGDIVNVSNSTLSGNSADTGGGISNLYGGIGTVSNSTLSGNSAVSFGGGISNSGTLSVSNTIIANSPSGEDCYNDGGTINNTGYNLVADNSCGFSGGSDPLLAPLADNGGSTMTHALLPNSPAIDTGNCTIGPATDQRGFPRPQDINCDIGAYEYHGSQSGPNFVVNITNDSDDEVCDLLGQGSGNQDCTLREAIHIANDLPGNSTITFAPALSGTIVLSATLGDLDIASNLTIDGGSVITVSGNNASHVFNIAAGNVTLDSLSIISGTNTAGYGGGILNDSNGTLTVTNSTLSGNSDEHGGGIFNNGTLTVSNSTFSGNSAGSSGGGIYNNGGTLTVSNSNFSNNSANWAGGILNDPDGTLTVSSSTLSGNLAFYQGGSIYNHGTLTASNSTFIGNSADGGSGGGIYNNNSLTVSNSTFIDNSASYGGGIDNYNGNLSVSNSTFTDNSASYGGGISNNSTLTVSHGTLIVSSSTFSGNSAYYKGGGIYSDSASGSCTDSPNTIIHNSTLSGNSAENYWGGGIHNANGVMEISHSSILSNTADISGGGLWSKNDNNTCTRVGNSIIAGNNGGGDVSAEIFQTPSQRFYSLGYNLIGTAGNNVDFTQEFTATGDMTNTLPVAALLANYGGDTWTHALLPGSPAIDAGDCSSGPATDQRGILHPQNTTCDIGAFESRGFNIAAVSGTPQSTPANSSFANPLAFTVSSAYGELTAGGEVIFTAPASGAGLTFTTTMTTIAADGTVSLPVTANVMVGTYTVTADFAGNLTTPAAYQLTNSPYQIFLPVITNNVTNASGDLLTLSLSSPHFVAAGSNFSDSIAAGTTVSLQATTLPPR